MRPDRIIMGEVRGGEAIDMLQAMNTGHDGSLTTVHANTPRDALARLETMISMAGLNLPEKGMRKVALPVKQVFMAKLGDPVAGLPTMDITRIITGKFNTEVSSGHRLVKFILLDNTQIVFALREQGVCHKLVETQVFANMTDARG